MCKSYRLLLTKMDNPPAVFMESGLIAREEESVLLYLTSEYQLSNVATLARKAVDSWRNGHKRLSYSRRGPGSCLRSPAFGLSKFT